MSMDKYEIIQKINTKITEIKKTYNFLSAKRMFVAGGAIVSMLRNEEVNDYDIYFTDKEDAKSAVYKLLESFNSSFGKDAYDIQESEYGLKITVAHNNRASLFLLSKDIEEAKEYEPICVTDYAITLKGGVQIITHFIGKPEDITRAYDFAHCACYYDINKAKLSLPATALESIVTNNLIYTGSPYPLSSMFRLHKFVKRGWNIHVNQTLKIALKISELDLTKPRILQEQLVGIDVAYFTDVINSLNETTEILTIDKIINNIDQLLD